MNYSKATHWSQYWFTHWEDVGNPLNVIKKGQLLDKIGPKQQKHWHQYWPHLHIGGILLGPTLASMFGVRILLSKKSIAGHEKIQFSYSLEFDGKEANYWC